MVVQVSKPQHWNNSIHTDSDELWSRVRNGEEEALSRLFCLFYSHLFSYGYNMIPRQAFVKDCIQELFLILWRQRDSVSDAYSVKSYLFHSLRRIILRNLTKQKNRLTRNKIYIEYFMEDSYNIEELTIHFETSLEKKEQLARALKSLSKRQKEAIYLKFYNGLSNTEISHVMGINQQSVYNHVSEAINKLQEFVQA